MIASAKRLARRALKAAAAGADRVRPPVPGVVVLVYHRVGGGTGLELDLPVARFREQISVLAESGLVVSLGDALDGVAGRGSRSEGRPEWSVVITFDDGTADFAEIAVPILQAHALPVTLYAATAFIDEQRSFPYDGRPLTWSTLADACTTGLVDVGSHTHRHLLLDRAAPLVVSEELDRSVGLIEERLGRSAVDFAYPKAVAGSAAADRAVRARFRSAALAGTRPNVPGRADLFRLARSPVQLSDGMRWFDAKVAGGMAFEDTVRRLANRVRYARARA